MCKNKKKKRNFPTLMLIYFNFFVKLNGTCGTKKENPEFEEKP